MSQGDVAAETSPLLQAIRADRDANKILHLIDHEPMAAQFRHANGRYPLHEACEHMYGDQGNVVIMKLLKVFPEATQFPDAKGWYPLHIACVHYYNDMDTGDEDLILRLVEAHPEAAAVQRPDASGGCYPLHMVLQDLNGDKVNVIMKLLELFPQAAHFQDEEGWYPLHIACKNGKPADVILKLIQIDPKAVAVQLPNAKGRYPLHLACRHGMLNGNVLMKLLEVFPQAAQFPDAEGWYPLHIACFDYYYYMEDDDVILKLIETHPEAATMKLPDASGGCYPLHLACKRRYDDVIMKLLELFPQAAHFQDEKGWYPLHIACHNGKSKDVILKLIEIHPDAVVKNVLVDDYWMVNPLQLLAMRDENVNVVEYLLQFPALDVNATTNEGNSLLHIAIYNRSFDIFDALLRHPFIIIDQRNHKNETPFDLVDKIISELRNLDDDHYRKLDLPKYQQVKKQLEDYLLITRWRSYEYFDRNVEDWSMK